MSIRLTTDRMRAVVDGAIGWMIFDNPERLNALSLDMWQGVADIVSEFEGDDAVRVIVLRGAGEKAFISGADISQFESERSSADRSAHYGKIAGRANAAVQEASKPTIAMIRGYCLGGGLGMALNCDLRLASSDSRFSVPAAKLGVGYDHRGLRRLMDLVGPAFAKEIFFVARQFDASEAAAMGLVNRVVEPEALEDLRGQSLSLVLLRFLLQVEREFLVQLPLHRASTPQGSHPEPQVFQPSHRLSPRLTPSP